MAVDRTPVHDPETRAVVYYIDWSSGHPIETAPRDGTLIRLGHPDEGVFHNMRWNSNGTNPIFQPGVTGIWEHIDAHGNVAHTWSEAQGFGPSLWWGADEKYTVPAN